MLAYGAGILLSALTGALNQQTLLIIFAGSGSEWPETLGLILLSIALGMMIGPRHAAGKAFYLDILMQDNANAASAAASPADFTPFNLIKIQKFPLWRTAEHFFVKK